jgi:Uma2 family endonuclease
VNADADADAEEDAAVESARLEAYDDPIYWELLDAIQRKHPAYDLEVRNGEYVVVEPKDYMSTALAMNIGFSIERWASETGKGRIFLSRAGVSFTDGDLIAADVTYVSRKRMQVVPRSFSRVVPDLVFEVRSAKQSERVCQARLRLLLDQGIGIAVFVDPGKRVWKIHRAGSEAVVLRDDDRFEVPDVLPGFSVAVNELWPK